MSDAPRWPGTDGGPGLDFSPYRSEEHEEAFAEAEHAADVEAEDQDHSSEHVEFDSHASEDEAFEDGSSADADPDSSFDSDSVDAEDAREGDDPHADDTQVHSAVSVGSPASAGSPAEVQDVASSRAEDDTLYRTAEPKPVSPRVAERAARTAQEWAAMPVGPGVPGSTAGAGAIGAAAGAALAGAAGVGAAGAAGAGAVGSPAPQRAPFTGPLGLRGEVVADADQLPLDEVAEAKPAAGEKPASTRRRPRRTRKARLRVARVDPWSVMKTVFLFAIAFGIMLVVATFVLWSVLVGAGTLEYVNTLLNNLFGDQNTEFDVTQILSLNRILGFSSIVAAMNVVIITALATLFAFLYNLAATVMGGLEVTLAED